MGKGPSTHPLTSRCFAPKVSHTTPPKLEKFHAHQLPQFSVRDTFIGCSSPPSSRKMFSKATSHFTSIIITFLFFHKKLTPEEVSTIRRQAKKAALKGLGESAAASGFRPGSEEERLARKYFNKWANKYGKKKNNKKVTLNIP